jgi:hypothetical protein
MKVYSAGSLLCCGLCILALYGFYMQARLDEP